MWKITFFILLSFFLIQCGKSEIINDSNPSNPITIQDFEPCDSPVVSADKVYTSNGETFLWGGEKDGWDFNITDWLLNECQLNFGLGREYFPALIEPQYSSISAMEWNLNDNEKCLLLKSETDIKVYPFSIMLGHEVVNEEIDGEAVMIVYCILADLSAVYTRFYCGNTLTFGTSGYTYHDDNIWGDLDAFVLWDRETESLWWPLIDIGVSGTFKSVALEKHDESQWEESLWKDVKILYPEAKVLLPDQTMIIPEVWPSIPKGDIDC